MTQNDPALKYVYIADDDEDDRNFISDAFLEIDPSVILKEAQDGMQLLDILRKVSGSLPEIIFLDINMPKMDGFDCLKEIRKLEGLLKDVIVIMFSTSDDPQDIEKAKQLGANFYAVKPSGFDVLKSFLENVLSMIASGDSNEMKFRLI